MVSKVQKAQDPKDGNKNTDKKKTNEEKESKKRKSQTWPRDLTFAKENYQIMKICPQKRRKARGDKN